MTTLTDHLIRKPASGCALTLLYFCRNGTQQGAPVFRKGIVRLCLVQWIAVLLTPVTITAIPCQRYCTAFGMEAAGVPHASRPMAI